jgi:ATP/maltotriose-dependent transcriptional regulator MalT
LFAQGNPPQAMPHLFDAFREAVATGAFQIVLEALLGIAQVSILPPGLANQLLTLVSEHSASNRYSRTLAKRLLSAKEFSITPPAPNVTLERRQALTLEAAVALVEQFYSEAEAAHGRSHQPLTDPLSQRELEILALIADGHTNQEIADRLVVGVSTVKKHINHIYDKLNATHRVQAVALARNLKILA